MLLQKYLGFASFHKYDLASFSQAFLKLNNPLVRQQSSSLNPSSSLQAPQLPLQVIWQSLLKAILEDNQGF